MKTTHGGNFAKTGSPSPSFTGSLSTRCLFAGLCLMCFALLLHPMSPEDFLALCLAAPQATWRNTYGVQAAILFWVSAVLVAAGSASMLHRAASIVRRDIQRIAAVWFSDSIRAGSR
jgi:hypothetical protein